MHPEVVQAGSVRPTVEDVSAAVYRHALRSGVIESLESVALALDVGVEEVRVAVEQLLESRLLRSESHGEPSLVPVDPEVAAALLVSPMEREIYQRRELIAQIRQRTDVLRRDYADTSRQGLEVRTVDQVVGSLEVAGFLAMAGEACRGELLVLLSGKQDTEEFAFQRVCLGLMARGVTIRIVGQHRCRADLTVRNKIKTLADAGAQVRTVSHVPRAAVVLDRSLAILLGADDEGRATASRVANIEVVDFLLDIFDHLWDIATPLDSFESGYSEVADDLQQTIAGLMAKGFTDEVLARKLGMSVRTCRRHIATLMRDLDAVSRFQAGVAAAQRGWLPAGEESADAAEAGRQPA